MLLGFALTRHCNLHCTHCIRDDVRTARVLAPEFVLAIIDDARALFGQVAVSFTGGEPLLHPQLAVLLEGLQARALPYRITSNGWQLQQLLPLLERYPPSALRLSLSGGTEQTHDAERGTGSFRRVLLAIALATSRRIPVHLSLIVDRRSRGELATAAALAESLGVLSLSCILPQPVPATMARRSDFAPHEWPDVCAAVRALGAGRTRIGMEYGAPVGDAQPLCATFALERIYIDAAGRLCSCCQLSEYGANENDVVADLHSMSLATAWPEYLARLDQLYRQSRPLRPQGGDALPCIRCARACGKLDWLRQYPGTAWHAVLDPAPLSTRLP